MIILSVEGNIGCGKSSILQQIESRLPPDVKILMEPVDLFQAYKGGNPLKLFYDNPGKYAFFTQSHIIESQHQHFYEHIQMKEPISLLIAERSLFSPVVFTNTLFKMGWLTQIEKEKLHEYSQWVIANFCSDAPMGAHYIFYMHEHAHVCKSRISERARPGESVISCTYLSRLEEEYQKHCKKFTKKYGDLSLRMVPHTLSKSEKEEDLLDFVNKILQQQQNV